MTQPGSLRPHKNVCAVFVAYSSSAFKVNPVRGHPAVNVGFRINKSND